MSKSKFFITTAIDYANAPPHLGHSYEKICADVIARWQLLKGEKVFFLTGTDEHGQKIEKAALKAKIKPRQFVDKLAKEFKKMCADLEISNDYFVRTTDKQHEAFAQKAFKKALAKRDIYKGKYEGYYCEGCEAFLTAKYLIDGKCHIHKTKAEWTAEESYMFKASKYQDKIKKHIEKNKEFIFPEHFRGEILNRLKEPLRDISVSRKIKWGIPILGDKGSVIYVWVFDALLNYLSAGKKYWPADMQIIGPDILWFHSVIWPCLLMSLGEKLPKKIVVHGFLTVEGEKFSKSRGNVIDPNYLMKKYGVNALRYYLMRNIPFGQDGDFSEGRLKDRYNNELANKVGNLISRVGGMASKGGKVVKANVDPVLVERLNLSLIENHMDKVLLDRALNEILMFVEACNEYVQQKQPWSLKGDEKNRVLYTLIDSIRVSSILLSPFIPNSVSKINKHFNFPESKLKDCKFGLTKSMKVKKPEILFKKIE